jgi:adenylate cyclase
MTRRLAAIVAADIADYSRLMHEDESATHARFTEIMNDAIVPAIAVHGGRMVKSTGDGFLAEFPSAVQAVQSAVQFQSAIARITADDPEERRLCFRVGVHLGDIIVEERDIYGDGVNIAARLEGLAERGGIMVSDAVHENVRGRLPCAFEDLGAQQVKNILRPVHLFRILPEGRASPRPQARRTVPDKPAVVVLPFQNLSGDPTQELLVDGIVEDLTTALSRFRVLFVIARHNAYAYKGGSVDLRQIGRELGARYVVEGSLRKTGNRLRVNGQAIQTDTGATLWADRYDRDLDDLFALQDEVTANIVSALAPIIQRAEIERARRKPAADHDLYDLYLCALAAEATLTREGNATARALLGRVLEGDPQFVPALVLCESCLANAVANGWLSADAMAQAVRHARLAVQLAPEDADALAALALRLAIQEGGDDEALGLAERAMRANPHAAIVLRKCGLAHLHAGQIESAVTLLDRSMRLGPNEPSCFSAWSGMALALLALGRDEEAVSAARKAAQFNANSCDALRALAASQALAGRADEAKAALARLLELDPAGAVVTGFGPRLQEAVAARLLKGFRRAGAMLPEGGPSEDDMTIRFLGSPFQAERILLITRPGEVDREITLGGTPLVVGRAQDSDIVLNDPKVSRAHCRIAVSQGSVTATDLRSTNGTLIDSRRIEGAVRLSPGTVLQIGSYQIQYCHREPPDPDRTLLGTARLETSQDSAEP